jgi:repressor of nif and glnA expression
MEQIDRKKLLILKLLEEDSGSVSSRELKDRLLEQGIEMSERTIRFHLLSLDKDGFTDYRGKKGRYITPKGKLELSRTRVHERVGFLSAKIDQLTYRMHFDLKQRKGTVIVNTSLIEEKSFADACSLIGRVFDSGFSMGRLLTIFGPGEHGEGISVPKGFIGIGTVCSITVNAVLLSKGIPINSVFGGLLEVKEKRPERFVSIIKYEGTSIDPLEIFIKSGMTDCSSIVESGDGLIGASFREIPADAREEVLSIDSELQDIGLGHFLDLGWPGQPLLGIPVGDGRIGAIVPGGLNPVSILEESGIKVYSRALAGFVPFESLFPYTELSKKLKTR